MQQEVHIDAVHLLPRVLSSEGVLSGVEEMGAQGEAGSGDGASASTGIGA